MGFTVAAFRFPGVAAARETGRFLDGSLASSATGGASEPSPGPQWSGCLVRAACAGASEAMSSPTEAMRCPLGAGSGDAGRFGHCLFFSFRCRFLQPRGSGSGDRRRGNTILHPASPASTFPPHRDRRRMEHHKFAPTDAPLAGPPVFPGPGRSPGILFTFQTAA